MGGNSDAGWVASRRHLVVRALEKWPMALKADTNAMGPLIDFESTL